MKAILRSAGLAVVYLAVLGCVFTVATAQAPCDDADGIAALDAKVRENYEKDVTVGIAIEAAKKYLQKYRECAPTKEFAAWLNGRLPEWEKRDALEKERKWRNERVAKFDEAVRLKKFDDVYAAGAELVQRYPDNVNYLMPLGLIGLYESYKNNFKYNDDTIKYAKLALAKLKNGKPEPKKGRDGKPILDANGKVVFGPFQFERNTEDALSELNYSLAFILYHKKNDKKAGLLYYYEVSQTPGAYKNEPQLYATIGQHYIEEAAPIAKEIVALIHKMQTNLTDEEMVRLEAETKKKIALYNGYNERALDAFSRAYKFADPTVASEKALKARVYTALQNLFERRFSNKEGMDKWMADAGSKPLPDPTSEVTPVYDPEPAKASPVTPDKALPASKPGTTKGKAPTRKPRV